MESLKSAYYRVGMQDKSDAIKKEIDALIKWNLLLNSKLKTKNQKPNGCWLLAVGCNQKL